MAIAPPSTSQPVHIHLLATVAGAILLALWLVTTIVPGADVPIVCRPRLAVPVAALLTLLLVWMCYEAVAGAEVGLAERVDVVAETCWPFVVTIVARRHITSSCIDRPAC